MPTIGIPPNSLTTQAVGAALLHQFARDRFLEAGFDEELIHEAEENLDPQTTELLLIANGQEVSIAQPASKVVDISQQTANIATNSFVDHNVSRQSDGPMNSTQKVPNISTSEDRFLSIVNNSTDSNSSANNVDNTNSETLVEGSPHDTTYHSMSAGRFSRAVFERFQGSTYTTLLRQVAEEFARSSQRETVRQQANKVRLENINMQSFLELLDELFTGGITREKIVVLFFFCTDVALRAASMAQELAVKLLCWSFSFIINTVCKKVDELGGWDNVLFNRVPTFLFSCLTILGICAVLTYLHKSIRSSGV